MKNSFKILALLLVLSSSYLSPVQAQSPEKMSYQAVIRDTNNVLLTNTQIGIQITILQGNYTGPSVYIETQTPTTNANGLCSLEIGVGTYVSGIAFNAIDWANGPYSIKTEIDPTGGTNYTIMGTSPLTSVPYALYAKTSGSSITAHYIGELFGGGVVFWVDSLGQHGLISATTDQSTAIQWYNGTNRYTGTSSDGLYAGEMNTTLIIATQMSDNQTGNFAAKTCADYTDTVGGITYGDWYLPSIYELTLLYQQRNIVGGFVSDRYWSSTEFSMTDAIPFNFITGFGTANQNKGNTYYVRAIRAF